MKTLFALTLTVTGLSAMVAPNAATASEVALLLLIATVCVPLLFIIGILWCARSPKTTRSGPGERGMRRLALRIRHPYGVVSTVVRHRAPEDRARMMSKLRAWVRGRDDDEVPEITTDVMAILEGPGQR